MGLQLSEKIIALINDPGTVKAVASTDQNGMIHLVFKSFFSVNAEGNIEFLEINETSQNNRNLIYSLWFKRRVSVSILGQDRTSYQIQGIPIKAIITGREFEKAYVSLQECLGEGADLSTIWILEPEAIREESLLVRKLVEQEKYPLVGHLDRFVQ